MKYTVYVCALYVRCPYDANAYFPQQQEEKGIEKVNNILSRCLFLLDEGEVTNMTFTAITSYTDTGAQPVWQPILEKLPYYNLYFRGKFCFLGEIFQLMEILNFYFGVKFFYLRAFSKYMKRLFFNQRVIFLLGAKLLNFGVLSKNSRSIFF